MRPGDNRSAMQSLQAVSEFDARENVALGTADYDCTSGVFSGMANAPAKAGYYCRSIYNSSDTDAVICFKLFGDSTTYTARIVSGLWFHCYGNIQTILDSGTTEATVMLGYSARGKIDGTGN
jgi:hypothetical protein